MEHWWCTFYFMLGQFVQNVRLDNWISIERYYIFSYRNGWPVALVYFRAGYSPNDYPSEAVCFLIISVHELYKRFSISIPLNSIEFDLLANGCLECFCHNAKRTLHVGMESKKFNWAFFCNKVPFDIVPSCWDKKNSTGTGKGKRSWKVA